MTTGAYPIDPATATGLFRSELGDVVATNIVGGNADYEYISDAQIDAFIAANLDSRNTAMATAKSMMATQMIVAAQDIQVDDIRIKTVERAKLMLEQANMLLGYALAGDAAGAFSVVPLTNKSFPTRPYGTPDPWSGVM